MIALLRSLFVCLLLAAVLPSAQAFTVLDKAEAVIAYEGQPHAQSPHVVALPYNWDRENGNVGGSAGYTLHFSVAAPGTPHALGIPRVGNAFDVALNGVTLLRMGTPGDQYEDLKNPRFIPIPQNLLRADNTLAITIHADSGRRNGLSPVLVGPADEIEAWYEDHYRWRVSGLLVVAIASMVLGGLAILIWFRQPEPLFLLYATAELLWAVMVSDFLFERTPVAWPWWGVCIYLAYALAPAFIWKFTLLIMGCYGSVARNVSNIYIALSFPAVLCALLLPLPRLLSLWLGVAALLSVLVAAFAAYHGVRSRDLEKHVLVGAIIVAIVAAVRDLIVFRILPGYGTVSWVRYAWVAFGFTQAWILAERIRKSSLAVHGMNQTLAERLAAREQELASAYARRADLERQQAVTEERQRLMRDMHDGMGSQLLGVLHMAQDPATSRDMLAAQLRSALDQLKLTVDALQDVDGDIASLLGGLRYRLGPRLEAAGIRLDWEVAPLPTIKCWTLQHSRNLQMILFEAFSNMVEHAGATQARLHAAPDAGGKAIRIVLGDNGRGFPSRASSKGQGMVNMQTRAASLGAAFSIDTNDAGTTLCLTMPVPE